MRNSLLIAALAAATALSGCSKSAEEAAPAASEAAASDAAAPQAAATLATGTFEVFGADGKAVGSTTINADGTYVDDDGKGHRVAGLVKLVDGKTCFDPSGSAPAECFTDSAPAADGSFTATDAKGAVLTIRPKAN
ncbi:hypothetical protein [Novosphingobium sp. B 225]|uniref:hypothetical protein n=1 Tax=Novosphingobium sp. B 225 TaxID=1961849 RepID=UPI000B4B117B|nr:hypothetical protein [Novosphingobium sp. B 225]